jgi:hypothetical protein
MSLSSSNGLSKRTAPGNDIWLADAVLYTSPQGRIAAYDLTNLNYFHRQELIKQTTQSTSDGIEFLFFHEPGKKYRWVIGNISPQEGRSMTPPRGVDVSSKHELLYFVTTGEVPMSSHATSARAQRVSGGMLKWSAVDNKAHAYSWSGHYAANAPDEFWSQSIRQKFSIFTSMDLFDHITYALPPSEGNLTDYIATIHGYF